MITEGSGLTLDAMAVTRNNGELFSASTVPTVFFILSVKPSGVPFFATASKTASTLS